MGEDEDRCVIGRVVSPPTLPGEVPLPTIGAKHVSTHDEGARVDNGVDLGLVLGVDAERRGLGRVRVLEKPVMETVVLNGAERLLERLSRAGRVTVHRDRNVARDARHDLGR